jgi:hypothetical protein
MTSSTPCAFQPCSQDGTIPLRSYKIKQARLAKQVPGWSNDQDIYTHAALVDRDRSCCVDQCPIIVSEFSLPAILHRPLPFRLKEGTPHRFLCLGHNLRYIDTLRKPMTASAVSETINKDSKDKKEKADKARKLLIQQQQKAKEAKQGAEGGEVGGGQEDGDNNEEGERDGDNNEGEDKAETENSDKVCLDIGCFIWCYKGIYFIGLCVVV